MASAKAVGIAASPAFVISLSQRRLWCRIGADREDWIFDLRSLPGQRAEEGDDVVFFLIGQLGPELRGAHYADRLLEAPHLPRMEIWRPQRDIAQRRGA